MTIQDFIRWQIRAQINIATLALTEPLALFDWREWHLAFVLPYPLLRPS